VQDREGDVGTLLGTKRPGLTSCGMGEQAFLPLRDDVYNAEPEEEGP